MCDISNPNYMHGDKKLYEKNIYICGECEY